MKAQPSALLQQAVRLLLFEARVLYCTSEKLTSSFPSPNDVKNSWA